MKDIADRPVKLSASWYTSSELYKLYKKLYKETVSIYM